MTRKGALLASLALGVSSAATAQRVNDNAVTASDDAFGGSIGNERTGIYSSTDVRGFSPATAGNIRLDGLYIDVVGFLNQRLVSGNSVRVGVTSLRYPFPAPTGIVDYKLRTADAGSGLSVFVQAGPFGTAVAEFDARAATANQLLSGTAGVSVRVSQNRPGVSSRSSNFAVTGRWRSGRWVVQPFYAFSRSNDDGAPTVFTDGSFVPDRRPATIRSQDWSGTRRDSENVGLLGRFDASDGVSMRLGGFTSRSTSPESYSELFRSTTTEGVGEHIIIQNPAQSRRSDSGELRVTAKFSDGPRSHVVHLTTKARRSSEAFGGSALTSFGAQSIWSDDPLAKPRAAFGLSSQDHVQQITVGAAYEGRWAGAGEISAGLQKTDYRKVIERVGDAANTSQSSPILYNATGALYVASGLSAYGGYTKGLEENSTAPEVAENRSEPLPALITSQREFGIRYEVGPGLRLIAGGFDIRKPYFNLDAANVFRQLGKIRNRGLELSLAGPVAKGLNIVAGAVATDPEVTGDAVESGRIGRRPVAFSRRVIRLNADYRFARLPSLSVDLNLLYAGGTTARSRPGPSGHQMEIPSQTSLDLGLRHRFKVAATPLVLRVQLLNLIGNDRWRVSPAGGFRQGDARSVSASVAADF